MTSEFLVYLQLGFEHIVDTRGYDHLLFIVVLGASYSIREWREMLWLVTAFTIGHSLTLALATLELVALGPRLVETLIPITIIATAGVNLFETMWRTDIERAGIADRAVRYGLALSFGLIHGMGFSNFLRSLLGAGGSLLLPLLSFNIGLEVGQILVLAVLLASTFAVTSIGGLQRKRWTIVLSLAASAVAAKLVVDATST